VRVLNAVMMRNRTSCEAKLWEAVCLECLGRGGIEYGEREQNA
jgi:hypothetical protein